MAFYFPAAFVQIDWSCGYDFLEQELREVVHDAELGKRFVDKLVRVHRVTGQEDWIYIHLEVQGDPQVEFPERMFVYNYRLYDRYRRPIASMVVLVDESESWHPSSFGFEVLGCKISIEFPTVKLLEFAGRESELQEDTNPFALVTLAHLLTKATRKDMQARFGAKWKLVQLLYRRGWDKVRIIDLFIVIDWMMALPEHLKRELWQNIENLEEGEKMRYVSSVEQIGIEKGIRLGMQQGIEQGIEQGMQQGKALALQKMLTKRFGTIPTEITARINAAGLTQIEQWFDRIFDAESLDEIFSDTTRH